MGVCLQDSLKTTVVPIVIREIIIDLLFILQLIQQNYPAIVSSPKTYFNSFRKKRLINFLSISLLCVRGTFLWHDILS